MNDLACELHVIAKDGNRLSDRDRAMIMAAADELESMHRLLFCCSTSLHETANQLSALQDRYRKSVYDISQWRINIQA